MARDNIFEYPSIDEYGLVVLVAARDNNGVDEDVLDQLSTLAGKCANATLWSLPDDNLVDCLDNINQIMQTLAAAESHIVREADGRGLAVARHASSTTVWLREHLRISASAAKRKVDLARAVDQRPALDAALVAGAVNAEQAAVIAAVIRDLPGDLGHQVVAKAEAVLIEQAGQFEPMILRKCGERILTYVAPEVAAAKDEAALRRQEARARQTRAFQLTRTGDGRVRLSGWLDEAGAATVHAALDPLCAPRHDTDTPRTPTQRRADALVEVCELATRTDKLPESGGQRPHVMVTMPFEILAQQVGASTLDTGGRLSPTEARQLACDAHIIPAVLGGDGQVLDVGRSRRLITGPLRRALELRDGGCAFPGCDRPPRWCDGHHIRSWIDGGDTALDNSVLLCRFHHRVIHGGQWIVRLAEDGMPEFIPPSYVDPERRPRRSLYHQRT